MTNFMKKAILQARESAMHGDVPVGAVIVKDNEIISVGQNRREIDNCPTAHAEIEAINEAARRLHTWRLNGCTIYVTLEPCPMCMGAIINSRIDKVVFGAFDLKAGTCGSVMNMAKLPFNHCPTLIGGIMEDECAELLTEFFKGKR